jgi:GH24 family phage-related lysozyme (muramidase)
MSSSASVLKEFLVKIGFKIDQSQERNFNESMMKVAKGATDIVKAFAKIGAATVAGTTASGLALHKMAEGMAGLYYASQRTGSSAKELKVLEYGFEQVGLSAEDARGSVEALAAARRQNPGLNGLLSGLGVKPDVDNAKVLVDLLGKLRGMAPYMRGQYASMFGLDEGAINQLELNGPAFVKALRVREAQFRRDGSDPDAAARKAVEFNRQWNEAKQKYADLGATMAVKLLPVAERFATILEHIADWLAKSDKATGGWVTRIGALGMALGPILAALKLTRAGGILSKLSGGGAAAVAGEAAGGGLAAAGAGAGGAGLLATIGLPAVVLAALGALIWLVAHPNELQEQVDQAHKIGDKMRSGLKSGLDWLNEKGKSTMAELQKQPGFLGDLARMTGKFEGFRDHVYQDVAGNATFGFGHKLKPGESMAGVDPISLFMSDLKDSLAAVIRNVKVKLSQNQLKALADLEFNIGEDKFRGSTLLRKLNAGDRSGAAAEFQRWNHIMQNGHLVANQTLSDRRAAEAQLFRTPDGKQITINAPTTINVDGSDSPKETAREIGRQQNRQYGDLVRNFGGAAQ